MMKKPKGTTKMMQRNLRITSTLSAQQERVPTVAAGKSQRIASQGAMGSQDSVVAGLKDASGEECGATTETTTEIAEGVHFSIVDPTFNLDGKDFRRLIIEDTMMLQEGELA